MIPEVVKLFLKGEGEVGIQLVLRGGVDGIPPTTLPGEDHADISSIQGRGVPVVMVHGGLLGCVAEWCGMAGG
jgi:hypothetical protein